VILAEDLRRQLAAALFDYLGDPPPPPTLGTLVGYDALLGAPPGMNGARYAAWIVQHALDQPNPDVFVRIVRLADAAQALVELQNMATAFLQNGATWAAPAGFAGALWIPHDWPFVDRHAVRDVLEIMAQGAGPPAASIEGRFGNGKKTMTEYVRALASRTGTFRPLIAELRPEPVPGALGDLATELWAALGSAADLGTTHGEPNRRATTLAREIALWAPAAAKPAWLVANVAEPARLEEGVLTFVDELLRIVQTTPPVAAKLRVLILCDDLSALALEHAPPVAARQILPQITAAEVQEWLEAATPGKDPLLYGFAAETVLSTLAAENLPPERQLQRLSFNCARAHRKLAQAPDA
jgi:hypothetical protein